MPKHPSDTCLAAVILAGGRAQRMGGIDKGLIELDGRPLIEHVIERLRPQTNQLMVSANRNHERYARYGYPVLADTLEDYPGPLAGMLAALRHSPCRFVLTVPCDAPLLSPQLGARLRHAVETQGAAIAVAHDGLRTQPTFALLSTPLADTLQDFLEQGGRKVGAFLAQQHAVQVDFSDQAEWFFNVNEAQDLTAARQLLHTLS